MIRYIITLLGFCCLSAYAANNNIELQSDHPDRYVVVKGDTLWGISGKFLKNPWQWPSIWKMNKAEIKNPNLIYPGDLIVLDTSGSQPELRLLRETVTLNPGVREEPLDKEAIPTIAPSIIAPFLSRPLVIEENALNSAPTIIAGPENRLALATNSRVYIDKIDESQGANWHIYRPGKPLVDPDNRKILGIEANYLGDARVLKYGQPATVTIISAKEEIFTKDKLVAIPENIQSNFVPHAPTFPITGKIISIYGGLAETGKDSIITINHGKNDGLEEGHVLSINRLGFYISKDPDKKTKDEKFRIPELQSKDKEPKVEKYDPKEDPANNPELLQLPSERVGLLMIFKVFDQVSYALVVQANEPINDTDIVQTPN